MAEGTTTKVLRIEVDSSQAVQAMAEYSALIEETKKREDALKKAIKEQGDESGQLGVELAKLKSERTAYTRALAESSKEVQNNIKQQKGAEGSLKSLRAQLSNLTKQYDELSKAEREGAFGKDLQKQVNDITKELKSSEEGTQRWYRNVGNYAGSLEGLFGQLQNNAKQALGGFQALGIGANAALGPVGIAIGAVVAAIQFFNKALHSSEELSMATSEAFAFLKSGAITLQRTMQGAGKIILNIWQGISGAIGKAANWVAKLLGKEKEWTEYKEERLALQTELTKQQKEENAITLEQRKINEKNADSELKIAKLRAEAADKTKYTASERIKLLKEAADEEEAISKRNYDLAKREYELQKAKAKLAGNSAEENEALSQAYTKMIQAETSYFNKSRELKGQISEATAQVLAEEKKLAEERKKSAEDTLKDVEALVDMQLELVRDGVEKDAQLEQIRYTRQVEALRKRLENEKLTAEQIVAINGMIETAEKVHQQNMANIRQMGADLATKDYLLSFQNRIAEAKLLGQNTLALEVEAKKAELDTLHQLEEESDEEFKARQLAAQQAYLDAKKKLADYEVQIEVGKWNAIGSAMNALSGLLGEFSEESKAAAVASKALALGEIAIKTGVALAGGIAQAQSVPFPANIAAIATTVATIIANIATAVKTVKSAKFSTGGYVSGEGTGTSDSVPAMLSNGESVNNARSTSMFAPIYSSLNQMGGGVPIVATQTASQVQGEEMLARAFAKGMSEADIRVGVDEITRVQNRVKVVENLGVL